MRGEERGFTRVGPVAVVALPAEIDMGNAGQAGKELSSAALVRGITVVVADLSRTRFCDSSGTQMLALAHRQLAARGGELRLVVCSHPVAQVLELMGITGLMPVFPNVEAALTAGPARKDVRDRGSSVGT